MKTKTNLFGYSLVVSLLLLASAALSFGNDKGNGSPECGVKGNGYSAPADDGTASGAPNGKGNG